MHRTTTRGVPLSVVGPPGGASDVGAEGGIDQTGPAVGPPDGGRPRGPSRGDRGRARGPRERWLRLVEDGSDAGMATAEYAIATVAAAGFAGLLILILRSDEVRGLLTGIVRSALSM